jgi:hypothetical protein
MYRVFVLGDIPPAERNSALNLRIRQWSPFAETGHYAVWRNETAQVWIWDEAKRRESSEAFGVNVSHIFPETVLREQLENHESLRIVSCIEGLEAQVWKNGVLAGSRWWAELPHPDEWKRFLLAHDLNPAMLPPVFEEIPWLDRPWGKPSEIALILSLRHERLWVSIVAAVFAFLLIWDGITIWRWRHEGKVMAERIAALTQEAEPLLEARTEATKYKESAERLISLVSYPAQLQLMADVAEKFPRKDVLLVEWRYNQGNLTFTLESEKPDPRYYVETYQKLPGFKDVSAEPGQRPNQLEVKMVVGSEK